MTGYKGPERVFSGIQPSGGMHLGNYLGAIRKFVDLQGSHDCIYCVVDLHAITVWQDPKKLRAQTFHIAASMLAAGVDPKRAIVFNQSAVPQHAELAWIFNCVARLGWLDRMTQFKDKAGKDKERASIGLYTYPVLQAADILVYKATHVPVGEDQKQHLELARDIAAKFNLDYKTHLLLEPEPLISKAAPRIMSLRDATQKMSKSNPSEAARINLVDDDNAIAQKFREAKTDPEPMGDTWDSLKDRPEAKNLVTIFAALADRTPEDVVAEYAGQGFGSFKPALADLAVAKLGPIRDEMVRLIADKSAVDAELRKGAERAATLAAPLLRDVQQAMGLRIG